MLDSCKKIANYYYQNNYTYDSQMGGWTPRYYEQSVKTSCCSIYVYQVLVDIGIRSDLGGLDVSSLRDWLDSDSRWQKIVAQDESDLQPGDIQIYKNGGSHTNIYAGRGQYWDAGSTTASGGAFKGVTWSFEMKKYTCSYRYKV